MTGGGLSIERIEGYWGLTIDALIDTGEKEAGLPQRH